MSLLLNFVVGVALGSGAPGNVGSPWSSTFPQGAAAGSSAGRQQPAKYAINLWCSRDVAPGPKIRLQINTTNLPEIQISAYKMPGIELLLTSREIRKMPTLPAKPKATWKARVIDPNQTFGRAQQNRYYSRQINLPALPPGLYVLVGSGKGASQWCAVNVTNLCVAVKRSPKRLLAWVTDFKTGANVPGAQVELVNRNAKPVVSGKTGKDGVYLGACPIGVNQTVIVRRGQEVAGIESSAYGREGQLVAHIQTDRPIYRPGQVAEFKAILRRRQGRGYRPVLDETAYAMLMDPKGLPVARADLTISPFGTTAGRFELLEEAALGGYTIQIHCGKDTAYDNLEVQEYRKPEFKVSVAPEQKRYFAGDKIRFVVDAQYYFGSPVPKATVAYTVRRRPLSDAAVYDWSDFGGNLGPPDTYAYDQPVADDATQTDDKGKAIIELPADPKAPDAEYRIELTVTDGSRREVKASGSVAAYAASIRLALQAQNEFSLRGKLISLKLRAFDLDGNPKPASVSLSEQISYVDEKSHESRVKTVASTTVKVPASGSVQATLPAIEEGWVMIVATAKDSSGRTARAYIGYEVFDPKWAPKEEPADAQIRIKLDRSNYTIGQTAHAYLKPVSAKRPWLATIEGEDIFAYKLLPAGTRGYAWDIKCSEAMSPSAFLNVDQWTQNGLESGNADIDIPDERQRLSVKLDSDKPEYRPGDHATVDITARDSSGRPISAEFALSVVDEAIYALRADETADLYETYWGPRENLVTAGHSQPQAMSGGAYQRLPESKAPVRQRFLDTAAWQAQVVTGPDGKAQIRFDVPGNLTTWRATARGVTRATTVGAATDKFTATRPVTLRLATPRQVVRGDDLTLIGTVNNRTKEPRDFDVELIAEGIRLTSPERSRVSVPAGGEARVEWKLSAYVLPEGGAAKLKAQVAPVGVPEGQRADYSDALEVPLRIVPDGVPMRFGASGTLEGSAEQSFELPGKRIEPASDVRISVRAGLRSGLQQAGESALSWGRWGTWGGVHTLLAACAAGKPAGREAREALAMISRTSSYDGWGPWETRPAEPWITAHALLALVRARAAGCNVPESLMEMATQAANSQFDRTGLWEFRALLASSLTEAGAEKARSRVEEVIRRGVNLSTYAQFHLTTACKRQGMNEEAGKRLDIGLHEVVEGPSFAHVPAGEQFGWSATDSETTSQALRALLAVGDSRGLAPKIAAWLSTREEGIWLSQGDLVATADALALYLKAHPEPANLGLVEIEWNGKPLKVEAAKFENAVIAHVPKGAVQTSNKVTIHRSGEGQAQYAVEATASIPEFAESMEQPRVLRTFETLSPGGIWRALEGPIRPGEPVRVSVVVWADERSGLIRVREPIPAGFEVTETESSTWVSAEVRDAAVLHVLQGRGDPVIFRYYLRAESEGKVLALPASAEVVRRPAVRGQCAGARLEVKKP